MQLLDVGRLGTLDLTADEIPVTGVVHEARLRIVTQMLWPGDKNRLRQSIARLGAHAIAALDSSKPEKFGATDGPEWEEVRAKEKALIFVNRIEPYGGLGAVLESISDDDFNREWRGAWRTFITVGQLLNMLRQIATYHPDLASGPSLDKAVSLVVRNATGGHNSSRAKVLAAWRTHRSVAHLCAAMLVVFRDG